MSIGITQHALNRYLERDNRIQAINRKILDIVKKGKEIKPKDNLKNLLNNNCKQAKYYKYNNLIAVVIKNEIVTIMKYNTNPNDWII